MELKVKRVRENAVMMKNATKGAAGMDLCACIDSPLTLKPREKATVPTGLAIGIEQTDCAAFLFARSGLSIKHGITLSNGVGVIDSDYRGEICVGLVNLSDEEYTISPKERIAQLVLMPILSAKIVETSVLDETVRGSGGFGSTGKI